MATLITAAAKKQQLEDARLAAEAAAARSNTDKCKDLLARDITNARAIPAFLNADSYAALMWYGTSVDHKVISAWLQEAGYAMDIIYLDTGNNDIMQTITIRFYNERGWENTGAMRIRDTERSARSTQYY
jgi:hypothetical protein